VNFRALIGWFLSSIRVQTHEWCNLQGSWKLHQTIYSSALFSSWKHPNWTKLDSTVKGKTWKFNMELDEWNLFNFALFKVNCECNLADIPSPLEITAYMTRMRFFIQMLGITSCKLCVGLLHVIVSSIGVAILLGVMALLLVGRLVTFPVQPIQLKCHCD